MARKDAKNAPKKAPQKRRAPKARSKPASVAVSEEVLTQEMAAEESPGIDAATSGQMVLPENLDFSAATELRGLLLARRGAPLAVDAGQVRRTGMQAVQILLAAAKTWQADGQSYAVTNPASEFLDTIALVGLSREHLLIEGFSR